VGYWILRAYKRDRVVTVIGYLNRARKPTAFTVDQKCESAGYNCPVLHDAFEAPVSKQNVSKRVLKQFQNRFRGFSGTLMRVVGNHVRS
jgi:tRNA A-37 threonylcarbamoyl transferase component Bud32